MFYLAVVILGKNGLEWRKVKTSDGRVYEYDNLKEAESVASIFNYKVVTQEQFEILNK